MNKLKRLISLTLAVMVLVLTAYGQGVTTASVKGKVASNNRDLMDGATVIMMHKPSGTQYGTITNEQGRFTIQGMRVGGPYTIRVSSVGFETLEQADIYLNLNQTPDLNLVLSEANQQIEEVTIVFDRTDVMSSERTGAETFVMGKKLENLPSIARGQGDFTRLTPQANGNSFGGRNNLYNNFSLDGSIFNNSFGLDYATPGGQSDAQPVSLDAIAQMQVSIAPFDVREGGFTGAGVNAVTKSGTNEIKATVYSYFRNENMIGSKVAGEEVPNNKYNTSLSGFSVGGPIIKNKLFYFVNAEMERRDQLAHGFVANNNDGVADPGETSVLESDIMAVQEHLRTTWGYEPGAYQGYNHLTYNDKVLAKLDWNINDKNTFTIRYNYLNAWKDILPHPEAIIGRGPTSYRLPFENSSYRIFNQINSVVSEINSRFGSKMSNKLLIGYTQFRDLREPKSVAAPVIDIWSNGNLAITAGSEMFSTSNVLNQNVFQFTDNLSYYANNHTITAGINYEQFYFENSFNLFYYPWISANSVSDFLNNNVTYFGSPITPADVMSITAQREKDANFAWSYVKVGQLGVYLQDEIQATDNLNLTVGLRVDVPIYLNEIPDDVSAVTGFNGWTDENGEKVSLDPSKWPSANPLWAPRLGFNWDVMSDKTLQVRGGSGIFSGRIPFVWLGNQASNARIDAGYEFQLNATSDDFRFPQVWKNNLAVDYKFGNGWTATFEGIYSKDINAVVHRNYNMLAPSSQLSGTGDDRAVFAGYNEQNIYSSSAEAVGFLKAGAIILDNVKEGYQTSLTAQISKTFDFGLDIMAAYSFLESKDYTSIPAEIAADAFQRNPIVGDPNQPMFSYSRYGLKHRIISTIMYSKEYKNMASSVAMFFEAGQGNRYSYTYSGDLNNDVIANNDLLYVPVDANDIHFGTVLNGVATEATNADAQWDALNAFIEQDDYLSTRRGDYAERNGVMLPWFAQLDFKFAQDFNLMIKEKKNTLRLSLDILNLGNLINSDWGVRQLANTWNPIAFNGRDANNVPYFSFDQNLKTSYINDVSVNSKWQLQIGVRYIFN